MRLDKYLKVSRLIKRRTVAKEVASRDRILINEKQAKPSTTVKPGDLITMYLGLKIITVRILTLDYVKKDELMYELVSEEKRSL